MLMISTQNIFDNNKFLPAAYTVQRRLVSDCVKNETTQVDTACHGVITPGFYFSFLQHLIPVFGIVIIH